MELYLAMDTASTVKTVARVTEFSTSSVARAAESKVEAPVSEKKQEVKTDQVKVSSSVGEAKPTSEDAVAEEAERVAEKEVERERAERQAQELETAIRRTTVQFKVSVGEGTKTAGSTGLHFQVIEAETGKVIREFPPDEFRGVLDRVNSSNGDLSGVLVNQSA